MNPEIILIYSLNLVLCVVLSFVLAKIYEGYGNAITYKRGFAKIFPVIALTTLIIISIVKTSIALSLGLVGALSIVRFRSAIKEPEELAYLFVCICIGLGLGANQQLYTVVGFVALCLVIIGLGRNNLVRRKFNYFIIVRLPSRLEDPKRIHEIVESVAEDYTVQRLEQAGDRTELHYRLSVKDIGLMDDLSAKLNSFGGSVSIVKSV